MQSNRAGVGEEFTIFISALFSNTNFGDNTIAVKLTFVKFYSFFQQYPADLRYKRGVEGEIINLVQ